MSGGNLFGTGQALVFNSDAVTLNGTPQQLEGVYYTWTEEELRKVAWKNADKPLAARFHQNGVTFGNQLLRQSYALSL